MWTFMTRKKIIKAQLFALLTPTMQLVKFRYVFIDAFIDAKFFLKCINKFHAITGVENS